MDSIPSMPEQEAIVIEVAQDVADAVGQFASDSEQKDKTEKEIELSVQGYTLTTGGGGGDDD